MSVFTVLMLTADSHFYRRLGWVLARKYCLVLRVGTHEALDEVVRNRQFDLILAQVTGVGGEDLAILKQIKRLHPRTGLILCSEDRQTAFPLEAYQLEVDDYLLMPCRLGEVWRRLANCLKRAPGKSRSLAAAPCIGPLNRAIPEKYRRVLDYFRYNLGASTAALKALTKAAGTTPEEKLMSKISAVASRLETLQEMAEEFWRVISGVEMINGFRQDECKPFFPLRERPATIFNSYPFQQPYFL